MPLNSNITKPGCVVSLGLFPLPLATRVLQEARLSAWASALSPRSPLLLAPQPAPKVPDTGPLHPVLPFPSYTPALADLLRLLGTLRLLSLLGV